MSDTENLLIPANPEFAPAFEVGESAPIVRKYQGNASGVQNIGTMKTNDEILEEELDRQFINQSEYTSGEEDEDDDADAEEEAEFLSCPHCTDIMIHEEVFEGIYQVTCSHCGVSGPRSPSKFRSLQYAQILFQEAP